MPITPTQLPDQPADDKRRAGQDKHGKSPSSGPGANDGDKGAEELGEDEGPAE